jgi:excisionase family DNA binding protein
MNPLLTPDQVSQLLGVPVKTLAAWRTQRTGPRFLRVGVHVRYRETDVEDWVHHQLDDSRRWMAS